MAELAPWPDVEAALEDILEDLAPTGTTTPAKLQETLPFIRIERFGGDDDRITDANLITIDTFAAVRADSKALAETIRARLLSGPLTTGSTTLDTTTTATAPSEVPWSDDQSIRRFSATYRITARR